MPSIATRKTKDGRTVYRVKVRRKGLPGQTATFHRLTDVRTWARITETAVLEGRHFKASESKRQTLDDMVDRYIQEVLSCKTPPPRAEASTPWMASGAS